MRCFCQPFSWDFRLCPIFVSAHSRLRPCHDERSVASSFKQFVAKAQTILGTFRASPVLRDAWQSSHFLDEKSANNLHISNELPLVGHIITASSSQISFGTARQVVGVLRFFAQIFARTTTWDRQLVAMPSFKRLPNIFQRIWTVAKFSSSSTIWNTAQLCLSTHILVGLALEHLYFCFLRVSSSTDGFHRYCLRPGHSSLRISSTKETRYDNTKSMPRVWWLFQCITLFADAGWLSEHGGLSSIAGLLTGIL